MTWRSLRDWLARLLHWIWTGEHLRMGRVWERGLTLDVWTAGDMVAMREAR